MILPLEQFLCAAPTGDPNKVWEELSKNDNPPALCGRVFRMGEPTYRYLDQILYFVNRITSEIDENLHLPSAVGIVELIRLAFYVPTVSVTRSTNNIATNWAHPWEEVIVIVAIQKLGAKLHVVHSINAMPPLPPCCSILPPERRQLSIALIECKTITLITTIHRFIDIFHRQSGRQHGRSLQDYYWSGAQIRPGIAGIQYQPEFTCRFESEFRLLIARQKKRLSTLSSSCVDQRRW